MNRADAINAITARHNEVIRRARELYPTAFVAKAPPRLDFSLRGRSVGGRAKHDENVIQYNLDWYMDHPERYLADTVPHEIAHIVARNTGLGKGHDYGWQRIDRALGGNGERCGNATNVKRARVKNEYLYRTLCGTAEVWVGPVHHSRLQSKGDIAANGRPGYALRVIAGGGERKIRKEGFTGQTRTLT